MYWLTYLIFAPKYYKTNKKWINENWINLNLRFKKRWGAINNVILVLSNHNMHYLTGKGLLQSEKVLFPRRAVLLYFSSNRKRGHLSFPCWPVSCWTTSARLGPKFLFWSSASSRWWLLARSSKRRWPTCTRESGPSCSGHPVPARGPRWAGDG